MLEEQSLDKEKDQGHRGTGSHNATNKDLSSKPGTFSEEQRRKMERYKERKQERKLEC